MPNFTFVFILNLAMSRLKLDSCAATGSFDLFQLFERRPTVSLLFYSSGLVPRSRAELKSALAKCITGRSEVTNTAPMRAVIRESGGMVFHAQADSKYFPRAPGKGTDEVMLSVRAAAINPVDYKVFPSF